MKQQSILKLKRKLKEAGTKFIDLKYAALTGTMQHITVPFERFEEIINEGVGADGSSLPGYKAVEKGDMLLFPDLTTLFFDPFFEHKTSLIRVISNHVSLNAESLYFRNDLVALM